jgi:hypothetical protein
MSRLGAVAAILSLVVARSGSAQELNLAAMSQARPGVVEARIGLDHAFLGEIGYRRLLDWQDQRLVVGGDVAIPWAKPDLRDHRIRATAGLPLGTEHWKLAGWLSPTLRGTQVAASRMTALGADIRLTGGYYAPRWFLASEVGLDWVAATHVTFSDTYRAQVYAGARDGWYRLPGGTAYTGIQTGVTIASVDVVVRAGHPRTMALAMQTVPFYLTLGVNVALPR